MKSNSKGRRNIGRCYYNSTRAQEIGSIGPVAGAVGVALAL